MSRHYLCVVCVWGVVWWCVYHAASVILSFVRFSKSAFRPAPSLVTTRCLPSRHVAARSPFGRHAQLSYFSRQRVPVWYCRSVCRLRRWGLRRVMVWPTVAFRALPIYLVQQTMRVERIARQRVDGERRRGARRKIEAAARCDKMRRR